jgi:6-hydroxycyclohex-1-ene-1-carbonyl-CoA dehydrogenase
VSRPDDSIVVLIDAASGGSGTGMVVATGDTATSMMGLRVLVGPIDPCGECEVCRRGGAAVCPLAARREPFQIGGRQTVSARWVVALGNGLELPLELAAAAAGDLAIAYTLYARTGIGPKEPAIVVGGGPIARYLVQILIDKGIAPTVVADPADAAWCDWLLGKGVAIARVAPDASGDAARATVAATLAAQDIAGRPWRIIACGDAALAAALAGPRATLTLLAPVAAIAGDAIAREVTIIGVAGAHPDLVVEAAALCVRGEIG